VHIDRTWIAAAALLFAGGAYATHAYKERKEFDTGVYVGKAAFKAVLLQNQRCLNTSSDFDRSGCNIRGLGEDSVMDGALASANIIPQLRESNTLKAGFRRGWQEARTAALGM
jgi:hypothetical protein